MSTLTTELDTDNVKVNKTRIIIADDHPLLRQALRNVLEKQPEFEIVAEVCDGSEAIQSCLDLNPNIVIMDISMPNVNGLEATRQIKTRCPDVAVLVLTVHTDSEHILSIMQAGASGYLTKSVYGDEIIHAIRALAIGETVLSPSISRQILKYAYQNLPKSSTPKLEEKLSSREMDVLRLAARGISNKDIAQKLGLSLRTVKGYLGELFLKLNATSRTEAVITSLRKGILSLDDLNDNIENSDEAD
jgi:two-component system, NarL family, response regulator LiaR